MKRICYVTTIPGTLKSFVIPVAKYLSQKTDWDITVICDEDDSFRQNLPDGIRYIPIPMKRGISLGGIGAMFKMYRVFQKEKFDLVQYSTPNASLYASLAAWLSGIKIRKYHLMGFRFLGFTGLKRKIFMNIERLACKLSTDIECVGKSNLEMGVRMNIFPRSKASVLHYGSSAGVDLERFDVRKKTQWRKELRDQFQYSDQDCVFAFVGRITRDKGINEMLEAFTLLSAENKKLFMVGRMEDEQLLDAKLLADARNSDLVTFCDAVSDIERYYAMIDVLLLPSYREGFGNIIIEAEAMGVPVIVSDIPGPIDAMEPGVTGLVVPVKNVEALEKAMQQFAEDITLREKMGAAGICMVKERFDQRILCEKILEDRKQLLE